MAIVVQGLWLGALGEMQRLSIRSFLAHGHAYDLYCYDAPEGVPEGARVLPAGDLLPRDEVFAYASGPGRGSPSAFSNLFRYVLLLERGGWWADLDVVCLRPWDLPGEHVFASETAEGGGWTATTCALRAPAGSEVMRECVGRSRAVRREDLQWGQTGPLLLDAVVRARGLEASVQPPQAFCPIDWPDYARLEAAETDFVGAGSAALHLWHELWRRAGRLPRRAPGNLYDALLRRYGGDEGRLA